ncbi:mycothione reductase [Hoyosella altamirensis]|uniref:Mycothione reductase n=1 Tax=Hoyosella altamirensis TaxID=616997 RepID=A0A839RR63_9ACTN|nr:mycothione reductase [Hoyosella altamirensis]MBB3038586.1 mycothione reductase [Hoyosella altamirensis]
MDHFDIAIIGAGSGNMIVNRRFADKSVAIIEANRFGGTCLNVGCIPTKMFAYTADVAASIDSASRFGIDAEIHGVDWQAIVKRVFSRIDGNAAAAEQFRQDNPNVTVFKEHASFTGPSTLELSSGHRITADQIVIATGARATVPEGLPRPSESPKDLRPIYTSDTIMRAETFPQRLVILGGGFIAAEFAHIFSSLGSAVTLISRGERLLRHHDAAVSGVFTDVARSRWDVRLCSTAESVESSADEVTVVLDDGSRVQGDALLLALGRRPNSDNLGLENAGVSVHVDGRVVVDDYQRTTAAGVWALGDVCAPIQLKHLANHEAHVVAHNLLNPASPRAANHRFIPSGVFTYPQIASVGLTSEQAEDAGIDFAESTHHYKDTAFGWATEDAPGFCKVLADRSTGQLIGAHVIGAHATTVIQPLIQGMVFGTTPKRLARDQFWIHPAIAEVVENALVGLRI